jgi:hypothetical protein
VTPISRRHALAAANFSQTGKQCPSNRAQRRHARERSGQPAPGQQHRRQPLAQVEQQRCRGQPLAPGAQHVGRADVARTDRAQVARPEQPRQDQAERHLSRAGSPAPAHRNHPFASLPVTGLQLVEARPSFLRHKGKKRPSSGSTTETGLSPWTNPSQAPILLFDSGVGGLSVLAELRKVLPQRR